jgi:hypothetical protein
MRMRLSFQNTTFDNISTSSPERLAVDYWKTHPEYNKNTKPLPFAYPGTDKPRLVDIGALNRLAERLRQSLEKARD